MKFSRLTVQLMLIALLLAQASLWGQARPYKPPPPPPRRTVPVPANTNRPSSAPARPAPRQPISGKPRVTRLPVNGRAANGNTVLVRGTNRMAPSSSVRTRLPATATNRMPQITGVNNARILQNRLMVKPLPKPTLAQQNAARLRLTGVRTKLLAARGGGNRGGQKPPTGGGSGPGGRPPIRAANDNSPAKPKFKPNAAPPATFPKFASTPKASEVEKWAKAQGWKKIQTAGGPMSYVDSNGVKRVTIKQGSSRTLGSEGPHIALRNEHNDRININGARVTRNSPDNHEPIHWDIK